MSEKPWSEMSREERGDRIREGRRQADERRAEEHDPEPLVDPPEERVADAAPPVEPVGEQDEAAQAAAERRRRLLGDLPPDVAALFTDAELDEIEADEKKKAEQSRKAQALKDIRAVAKMHAEVGSGLLSASVLKSDELTKYMNEDVKFTVVVPNSAAGRHKLTSSVGIRINGFIYEHGKEYVRPRHVYNSLVEVMWRSAVGEAEFRTLNQDQEGFRAKEVAAQMLPMKAIAHAA